MMFDAYGRVRASLAAREDNDGILMGTVPTRHIETLYTRLGDWPVALGALFLLAAMVNVVRRRTRGRPFAARLM